MAKKNVYYFGGGKAEGRAEMKELLGGKGANLAEMSSIGIPVPPGFTITTDACVYFFKHGNKHPAGLKKQVAEKKEVKETVAAEEKISVEEEVKEEKEDIALKEDSLFSLIKFR